MKALDGHWLIGLGLVHTAVGLVLGGDALTGIARDGFVATIEPFGLRMTMFWFLIGGLLFGLIGAICVWIERETGQPPPRFIATTLLAVSVVSVVLIPYSGFWLLGALSIWLLRRHRPQPLVA